MLSHFLSNVIPHAAKDVRLLDLDQVTRRINALMDYLFGITRNNESEFISILAVYLSNSLNNCLYC